MGLAQATHGAHKTRLYNTWAAMRQRCSNSKDARYSNYGERGITVCAEWRESFPTFRDWALTNGYGEGLEIDRRDNNGDYSPENCRWVTRSENLMNRRMNSNNTSGFKGVSASGDKWEARIGANGSSEYLGRFATPEAAAHAYDEASMRLHGEFGKRNFADTLACCAV
jgi:hypothetical protein